MQSELNYRIYFDNAATSFPKPAEVTEAVAAFLSDKAANPGRSGHTMSMDAAEIVFVCREKLADFFGLRNPLHIIFTVNATEAVNLALNAIEYGSHIVIGAMEHNAVARSVHEHSKRGRFTYSIAGSSSNITFADIEQVVTPRTKAVILNHASNVSGTVTDISSIFNECKKRGFITIADIAQSAGVLPVNLNTMNIDLAAFAGHKSLMGPMGSGGLLINDSFDFRTITPLVYGGTGSASEQIEQPQHLPDYFESGTINAPGIAGLSAALDSITQRYPETTQHKNDLVKYFYTASAKLGDAILLYVQPEEIQTGTISFNLNGISCEKVSTILSEQYNIMSRAGLHCSPLAHKALGTFPGGTVRFSFSAYNKLEEIDVAMKALTEIAGC